MTVPLLTRLSSSASRGAARYIPLRRHSLRNNGPLVSFTFDDVPDTAFTNGAAVLDSHGIKGTFYIAPGILGVRDEHWRVLSAEQVAELHRRGHEVGCHTFSHVKVQNLSHAEMARENALTRDAFRRICGPGEFNNFAYPYGVVSMPRKLQLQDEFGSCRGIYQEINARSVDLGLLRAFELYDRTLTPAAMEQLIDDTVRCNGWLIFYTHDVVDNPSWIGCSPGLLDAAARAAKARGVECVSIAEGLERIGAVSGPVAAPATA